MVLFGVISYINRMVMTFLTTDKRKFLHSKEMPIELQRHSS